MSIMYLKWKLNDCNTEQQAEMLLSNSDVIHRITPDLAIDILNCTICKFPKATETFIKQIPEHALNCHVVEYIAERHFTTEKIDMIFDRIRHEDISYGTLWDVVDKSKTLQHAEKWLNKATPENVFYALEKIIKKVENLSDVEVWIKKAAPEFHKNYYTSNSIIRVILERSEGMEYLESFYESIPNGLMQEKTFAIIMKKCKSIEQAQRWYEKFRPNTLNAEMMGIIATKAKKFADIKPFFVDVKAEDLKPITLTLMKHYWDDKSVDIVKEMGRVYIAKTFNDWKAFIADQNSQNCR